MLTGDGAKRYRILFLTPQLPYPPEQGTAIRNFNLIAQVAKRHDVALLSFADAGTGTGDVELLKNLCVSVRTVPLPARAIKDRLHTLLLTHLPDMAYLLFSPEYAAALRELLTTEAFDIIHVEGIELARYGSMVRQWMGERAPAIVFDDHNAEYVLQRRSFETDVRHPKRWAAALYSLIQWRRLFHFERRVCRLCDAVLAVSDADARALERLAEGLTPLVIPNGVDVARYTPDLPDAIPLQHPAIVFTGKMDFRPNVDGILWFYRHVWPLVRLEIPDAHLWVVGKSPHRHLAPLAADAGVTVTGYVPDILPYFGGADVYIVPLRIGGGTRLKVLEAMSAGLPLVSTTLGVEGIGLVSGEHALLADAPSAFALSILSLLRNLQQRATLGKAARAFVLAHYDWRRIVPRLEPLYASLVRS